MADTPVEFDQKKLFNENDPLMKATLTNVATFAGDVSVVLGNLTQFLNLTKTFLQAVADPLALVLIPSLNALIAAIEDLKNIGFGSLSVWPWEVGRLESGVDTTKLEQALTALIASLSDVDAKRVFYDPVTKSWKVLRDSNEEVKESTFDFTPFSNVSSFADQNIFERQDTTDPLIVPEEHKKVKETITQVMNFLNPSRWDDGDSTTGQFIKDLNESFKFRTLTPSQFVQEVNKSFDDTNDSQRPVGSGDYLAFVTFFALPTHHALRDMTQALIDFFSNFVENLPELTDDKIQEIELGEPLVFKDLEKNYKEQTGRMEDELNRKIEELENTKLRLANDESASSDTVKTKLRTRKKQLQDLRIRKQILNTSTPPLENKIYGFTNTTNRKLHPLLGSIDTVTFTANTQNNFIGSNTYSLGPYSETVQIPMFKPGDLIQQGTIFNNFTAEVVEHLPIQIRNGKILKNTVKVKSIRGDILLNTSTDSATPNSPPVVRLGSVSKSDPSGSLSSLGPLKVGKGFDDYEALLNHPMFSSGHSDAPNYIPSTKFIATMISNDNVLRNVLPADNKIIAFAKRENIYDANFSSFNPELIKIIETFVGNLAIGQPIDHDYFSASALDAPTVESDFGFKRSLHSILPGLGVRPVIKNITINGQELQKNNLFNQLFILDANKKIVGMNEIRIVVGRLVKSGSVDDYPRENIKVPNSYQNFTAMNGKFITAFSKSSGSSLPNWKFTRIQDLFPFYGQALDFIISKIEFAKDLAEGSLKQLNEAIQYLEDLIEDLINLNNKIQQTLSFFANGLNKAGLYSAKISGTGGIEEFKTKLSSAKVKNVNFGPVPEFDLQPVTTTSEVTDPISGDVKTVETTVMKLVVKTPTEEEFKEKNPDGTETQLLNIGDLNSMKYSGGFVLFAMGNDRKLLDKFLKVSGIKKREEIENPGSTEILPADITTLLDSIHPFVSNIRVQRIGSSDYVDSESATNVDKNTGIEIVFGNNSDQLTDDEKAKIRSVRGDDFEFLPDMQSGSVFPNVSEEVDKGGNIILSADNFSSSVPLSFSVEPVKENDVITSVILKPKNKLPALTNFKLKIKPTITRIDGLILKDEFVSELGFTTSSTIVTDINFE